MCGSEIIERVLGPEALATPMSWHRAQLVDVEYTQSRHDLATPTTNLRRGAKIGGSTSSPLCLESTSTDIFAQHPAAKTCVDQTFQFRSLKYTNQK